MNLLKTTVRVHYLVLYDATVHKLRTKHNVRPYRKEALKYVSQKSKMIANSPDY